jgi:hypothetical protein
MSPNNPEVEAASGESPAGSKSPVQTMPWPADKWRGTVVPPPWLGRPETAQQDPFVGPTSWLFTPLAHGKLLSAGIPSPSARLSFAQGRHYCRQESLDPQNRVNFQTRTPACRGIQRASLEGSEGQVSSQPWKRWCWDCLFELVHCNVYQALMNCLKMKPTSWSVLCCSTSP